MKKTSHNIAILGFGVVGGGVAKLVTDNSEELFKYTGKKIVIKRILDLRDFPDSPFASLVTHSFDDILADDEIDTVIEVMGGSHPAYEFTVAALKKGKNVISSNKEVVANFGDEFVSIAREMGVSYRFEAAVGGGIPVISPLLFAIRQNKMREVRGILNGTTNYILTKMFTYGDSFESALADAQARGYAERNPDADVLGIDASRKIAILAALGFDMLAKVDEIPTEGITGIRAADVKAAESIGHKIKLLGRCVARDGAEPYIMVAPFLLPSDSPLSSVNGVYNAIEVVAEPLGNVMFYGQGAGAGATASAVVSDLIPIIAYDNVNPIVPGFNKTDYSPKSTFDEFVSKNYIALPITAANKAREVFGDITEISVDGEFAFTTEGMTEKALADKLETLGISPLSRIRFL
ncbi:MAG: homoserine dehydrogenase [Clostridia bacterium]|nr:homoserine dehydrogenase [Clostridia bacterium]